ncbi:MAG: 23S rRNA (guanosine(2251)-2'-O)-methyltransferase RlmB [Gammaproteobacteria bacterium]
MKSELVVGLHAVRQRLSDAPVEALELWVLAGREDARLVEILKLAARAGLAIHSVPRHTLDRLASGLGHQGVVLRCRASERLDEDVLPEILAAADGPLLLLVLDGVQDPRNLGACLRTAEAAGVAAVIVPRHRGVGITPVVAKVASGAAARVPLIQAANLARALRGLRDAGVAVIGATSAADQCLFDSDLSGPVAIVVGGEGRGLRRLTRELCDHEVQIPMRGAVESLNVSVAAAVCLFEAVRQRHARIAVRCTAGVRSPARRGAPGML